MLQAKKKQDEKTWSIVLDFVGWTRVSERFAISKKSYKNRFEKDFDFGESGAVVAGSACGKYIPDEW